MMYVACLHNVISSEPDAFDKKCSRISKEEFSSFIQKAKEKFSLVSFADFLSAFQGLKMKEKKPLLALSFDDGFRGVFTEAFPLLEKENISAALFVNPLHLNQKEVFHFLEIEMAFRLTAKNAYSHPALGKSFVLNSDESRVKAMKAVKRAFKLLTEAERKKNHFELMEQLGLSHNEIMRAVQAQEKMRVMSPSELLELKKAGWVLGAHTLSHRTLSKLAEKDQREEIVSSKKSLDKLIEENSVAFAYPYGEEEHIGKIAPKICQEVGLKFAFTTIPGEIKPNSDPFLIHRIDYKELVKDYL